MNSPRIMRRAAVGFLASTIVAASLHTTPRSVTIVIPDRASPVVLFAAGELQTAFKRAGVATELKKQSESSTQAEGEVRFALSPARERAAAGSDSLKPQEYAVHAPGGASEASITGGDDRGVLYGTMDFIHDHLTGYLAGTPIDRREAPHIATRGIWTWGGRIYNYERLLDNMARWKFNSICVWHRFAPKNARALAAYARTRGIGVVWGYAWGWGMPVCPSDSLERETWKRYIIETYRTTYAAAGGEGVYFQTFTEVYSKTQFCRFGEKCPNGCTNKSAGELLSGWVNPLVEAFAKEFPGVRIYCGVHGHAFHESLQGLDRLDRRAEMVWEDVGAFPFDYNPEAVREKTFNETTEFVRRLASAQGPGGNTLFVFKGMVMGWGGFDPMLVTDEVVLTELARKRAQSWLPLETGWRENAGYEFQMVRIIENLPIPERAVYGLVEDALFEVRQWLPVALFAESLWNPHRDTEGLIKHIENVPDVVSVVR